MQRNAYVYCLIWLWLMLAGVCAQPSPSPTPAPAEGDKTIPWRDYHEALKTERELLEKQAERNFSGLQIMLTVGGTILGGLLVVTLALGGFFYGKTLLEVKASVRDQIEKAFRVQVEQEVEQALGNIRTTIDELTAFKTRQVLWVFSGDKSESAEREIQALQTIGLEKIQLLAPAIGSNVELGNPDLVVFSFDGSDEARRRLKLIVDALKLKRPPVFLLLYTYAANGPEVRIGSQERDILNGFDWFLPANFPATVVANAQLLIRKRKGQL